MSYRTRTLLTASIGLLVLAGLSAYAYFGLYKADKRGRRQAVNAQLVFDVFDKQTVQKVTLLRGASRSVVERTGLDGQDLPVWRLVEPLKDQADGLTLNAFLGVVERLASQRRIPLEQAHPLGEYGLDPARVRWLIEPEQGPPIGLLIGDKNPFDNSLYVMREGAAEIGLVDASLEAALVKSRFDLREKALVFVEPAHMAQLVVERRSGTGIARIELHRRGGKWFLNGPGAGLADQQNVARLIATLRNLRALSFAPEDSSSTYGLAPPALKVEIRMGSGSKTQLVWFGRQAQAGEPARVYAQRVAPAGPVCEIRAYQLETLEQPLFTYLFKAPMDFERERVAKIKIASDETLVVLERRQVEPVPSWSLVSPVASPVASYRVNAILTGLHELRALRLGPEPTRSAFSELGLASPRRTVQIFDENDNELSVLKLGRVASDGTWVQGAALAGACLVDTGALETLTADLAALLTDAKSSDNP
jgi:hypothetical protein